MNIAARGFCARTPNRIRNGLAILSLIVGICPALASAKVFMTQEELLQTIPGSVISAKSDNGTPWTQTYSAYKGGKKKGTISVNFGGLAMKSKWFVKDNQWCENWGSGQACWDIERVGTKSLQLYENGEPKKNLWNLN